MVCSVHSGVWRQPFSPSIGELNPRTIYSPFQKGIMMKPKIGFIGIGIMGAHMSRHLLNAGYQVVALDLNKAALDAVVAAGAEER